MRRRKCTTRTIEIALFDSCLYAMAVSSIIYVLAAKARAKGTPRAEPSMGPVCAENSEFSANLFFWHLFHLSGDDKVRWPARHLRYCSHRPPRPRCVTGAYSPCATRTRSLKLHLTAHHFYTRRLHPASCLRPHYGRTSLSGCRKH